MLYTLALDLRDLIEAQPDILSADLLGSREELLEAVIDPKKLETYGLSSEQIINSIARNNRLIPAGSLDNGEGRFAVKVPSVIENYADIYDIPVKSDGDSVIALSDVAEVRRTFKDRTQYSRVDGKKTIALNIVKRANSNVIQAIANTKSVTETFRQQLPAKVDIFYSTDQAPYAESQVVELEGNILTALCLVMVIVVAAMGIRSGLIVGFGIPASFLFSLIFIYLLGYSFNFMVMFGMLLGLGMLIDGRIVVTEYADRKMTEGLASQGCLPWPQRKRMFWPVTASIATTLAAFLPLMFWPGISGKFMRFLPGDRIYRAEWVFVVCVSLRSGDRRSYRTRRQQRSECPKKARYIGEGRSSRSAISDRPVRASFGLCYSLQPRHHGSHFVDFVLNLLGLRPVWRWPYLLFSS
jgi:multidrug efflux pump